MVTTGVFSLTKMILGIFLRLRIGQISGQKYEFPAFAGKIMYAHTVRTRPLLLLKGLGTRLLSTMNKSYY